MGLAVSVGKDNDELVDNLIDHESIKKEQTERIMRLVDRARFMPEEVAEENAYKDSAWKADTGDPGFLHLSAPCIYASVLENLDLAKGMSFLNVGSGTGYLSTMVGFILGEGGINHGVELYENIVDFANDRVSAFLMSKETSAFEWCTPTYFVGNAFQIEAQVQYDRIYCGALVPDSHRAHFCSLLKIGGILIMPYGHALQRITRLSETDFNTRDISAVTFSHLIPMNPENPITNRSVKLPLLTPLSLQQICRNKIRQLIRAQLHVKQPAELMMRNHIATRGTRQREEQNAADAGSTPAGDRDRAVRVRPRLMPAAHRLMNHPVVLFERDEQQQGGEGDDAEDVDNAAAEPARRRVMPVRRLFAMFARNRLHRHHEARARQAAEGGQQQLPARPVAEREVLAVDEESSSSDDSDSEVEELEEVHQLPGQQQQQNQHVQLYNGPNDNTFGFKFIAERPEEEEDDPDVIGDLFEQYEGGRRAQEEEAGLLRELARARQQAEQAGAAAAGELARARQQAELAEQEAAAVTGELARARQQTEHVVDELAEQRVRLDELAEQRAGYDAELAELAEQGRRLAEEASGLLGRVARDGQEQNGTGEAEQEEGGTTSSGEGGEEEAMETAHEPEEDEADQENGSDAASDRTSASFVTAQNDVHVDENNGEQHMPKTSMNNAAGAATASAKRPRERSSTSGSVECAPQASKIQRKTNGAMSPALEFIDSTPERPVRHVQEHSDSGTSTGTSSSSSTSTSSSANVSASPSSASTSNAAAQHVQEEETSNVVEVKAEEQLEQLRHFHEDFLEHVEHLPLTVQMRKYIQHQI